MYIDDKKYSAEDFASYTSIDSLGELINNNWSKNDIDGYTPLCAAILNNVDSLMLLYLTKVKTLNNADDSILPRELRHTKNADPTKMCNKGKTPIQIAILASNTSAINILFGQSYATVKAQSFITIGTHSYFKDIIIYQDGLPQYTTDESGNSCYLYKTIDVYIDTTGYSFTVTPKDIYEASSLPKVDLLAALGSKYDSQLGSIWSPEVDDSHFIGEVFNDFNYSPLIAATSFKSYDSINYILDKLETTSDKSKAILGKHSKIADTDGTDESSFDVAVHNGDIGAIIIFLQYTISEFSSLDAELQQQIAESICNDFITESKDTDGNTTYTANKDLLKLYVDNKVYYLLNSLHISNKLVTSIDDITVTDSVYNKQYIIDAVNSVDISKRLAHTTSSSADITVQLISWDIPHGWW